MSYRPTHAKPSALVKFAARGGVIAGAAAIAAVSAGSLAVAAANAAGTPLGVTLGSQDGATATWSANGDPVLALGSDASGTGAWATITPASDAVPTTEPVFTTDNYAAGSPRWDITLSNGAGLFSNQSGNGSGWEYNTGSGWQGYGDTYAAAVTSAEQGDSTVTVKSAQIVADGDQPGASDTITGVSYDGQTIGGGTVSLGSVATQHATVGTAFSLTDAATTTSSDPALTYKATGLPAGLTIDSGTGKISGTPTQSGQFSVTVHAVDVYGDGSAYQHFVLDVSSGVTYSASVNGTEGVIRNAFSGKYLNVNVPGSTYATGNKLIQWDASGASHEKFEIVTIKNNSGTVAGGYLEAVSPSGQAYYVTATGSGQLSLGGEVLGVSSADLRPVLSSNADMLKSGPYYTFPNDGNYVMDDAGQSTANGAHVIAYPSNGGKNQQWSLP